VKLKRKEPELKQIQSQAQGVQTRLKYSHTELDTLRKKSIPNCHAVNYTNTVTVTYSDYTICKPPLLLEFNMCLLIFTPKRA
jgi:hypothetical protein